MAALRDRIGLLADIFLAAAYSDGRFADKEHAYVRELIRDLLSLRQLPPALEAHIAEFDPRNFDLRATAAEFVREPPMSRRRLMELIGYVTMADGEQSADEDAFLRAFGEAIGLQPSEYADLTRDRINLRNSFIGLARVPLTVDRVAGRRARAVTPVPAGDPKKPPPSPALN
jgi:tellurite resistance protein